MASRIIGCGGYLPSKIITNKDLEKTIDTSDEWIRSRTGINQRHIAADDEYSSNMGHSAALSAIQDANIDTKDIDLIIACSNTPDQVFPGVANMIQGYLELGNTPSFDLSAICSGFIYGMQVADNMIKSEKYRTILLVCVDKMSSILDWQDRTTCILFGDGAGAVILQHTNSTSGIIDSNIYSDGSMYDMLHTSKVTGTENSNSTVKMKGSEVFKKAVEKMSWSIQSIIESNNLQLKDIDYLIPHQANQKIINSVANKLDLDPQKVVSTIKNHANCSAASIPLALTQLKLTKTINTGELFVFTAFGAGATWGAVLLKW